MSEKKKTTRLMKVTLDADEFEKFDNGETHSDKGLRSNKGQLSALPDIAPVSEDDLPQREVIRTKVVYKSAPKASNAEKVAQACGNIVVNVLSDPEVQKSLTLLVKSLWHNKVMPSITARVQGMKDALNGERQASKLMKKPKPAKADVTPLEFQDEQGCQFVVTKEQAEWLLAETRKKARELSEMIFLLSNICIKDEKTQEECTLQQSYIKELTSKEAVDTMRTLVQHKQLLGEDTVLCFSDFLKGYIRNGKHRIRIPVTVCSSDDE